MAAQRAEFKENGNKLFASGDYIGALTSYTEALNLCGQEESEKVVFYKNRAAAYLKLGQNENALNDCNAVLEKTPNDVKALFRRCQAHENLEHYNDAFKDARLVQHLEPQNKAMDPILRRLSVRLQDIAKEQSSTSSRGTQMLEILCNPETVIEKRVQAANNLFVLSRERAGSEFIISQNGIEKVMKVIKSCKNDEIILSLIRVFGEICKKNLPRTKLILKEVGIHFLIECMNCRSEAQISAAQYVIQTMLNALAGMDPVKGVRFNKDLREANESYIDEVMMALTKRTNSRTLTSMGRDAVLEVLMKNVDWEALYWGLKLVHGDGLYCLLEVATELQEVKYESSMEISDCTRINVAVTLDRVYICMDHDKARETYTEKVKDFINDRLKGTEIEAKVRIAAAITALLQGPIDVGNQVLAQQGVVEMLLIMANTDDELQQRVAAEAIIAAASKKDKCTSILSMGTGILKNLFQSKNDSIKVRALVGLCKIGSFGGTDASIKPFSDGSNLKLALACRRFLINPKKDRDLRKWAAEGLSYLTLDAEVKEELIQDEPAIRALIELAKVGGKSVLYGVVTTLVNLTNSYDKQEILPELIELAKFAKQHIPEEHIKDSKDFIDKRIKILSDLGVTTALVALSNTESKNSKELISRVFNSICESKELRGAVVQQGGAKVLVSLALENTDNGKLVAGQALARIGITINPEVAFPGQRCAEVVRPLKALLHPDCSGLQNFEALMALTNLAQVSETVRTRILSDSGLTQIENYMYEEHEEIKRAAVQCIVNLIYQEQVVHIYEGDNDRVKYLMVLSGEEDYDTVKAASGALAMLLSISTKCCKKVFDCKVWEQTLMQLTASEDVDLMHRGLAIVQSLVASSKEAAQNIVDTKLLEVLMALMRPEVTVPQKLKELAQETLSKAESYKLIRKPEDSNRVATITELEDE